MGENIGDLWLKDDLLGTTPKAWSLKEKLLNWTTKIENFSERHC